MCVKDEIRDLGFLALILDDWRRQPSFGEDKVVDEDTDGTAISPA